MKPTYLLLIPLLLGPILANATRPLFDLVEIDGQTGELYPKSGIWIDLPASEGLTEIEKQYPPGSCSAIGGPRGVYAIRDNKLFLTSIRVCGASFELKDVYPQRQTPMLADWVSGELTATTGKVICPSNKGDYFILENLFSIRVERGLVKSMRKLDNGSATDCQQ